MEIKAVVDRIENGYAILKSEDYEMEICIPADDSDNRYFEGENITLLLNGNVENNG
ncbi:hypothetical protein [Acetivibrio clariflavus]|uniref:Uncharacterized protein n=1 Tax=Acetivibrio clariflavus (strain DSM 19732 / NBRC 101661 / EBR45) TaxID=720554 RepID=G8M1J7_ACECE|nr:hypothetical protein [Acetivibrio clariflavus]AEV69212.1 hypothetical protein Clocl_2646 [Acetivibrio clariflavus DSM 19732]HOQ01132.1 hypothetical protein [Acetivibrio clariflavus]HPU41406.1 hypothetical protein [Acetivibrio clariflavus]